MTDRAVGAGARTRPRVRQLGRRPLRGVLLLIWSVGVWCLEIFLLVAEPKVASITYPPHVGVYLAPVVNLLPWAGVLALWRKVRRAQLEAEISAHAAELCYSLLITTLGMTYAVLVYFELALLLPFAVRR